MPCCESRPHFARTANGVDAVRAAARDEFRKGAAHLKVLLSGGVASPHDEIAAVHYSEEEIRAAVQEAENHNRYVTARAYHPRAIDRALLAGVRCIEHGNLIDDATIALLVERDAFLVPTLVAYAQSPGPWTGRPGESPLRRRQPGLRQWPARAAALSAVGGVHAARRGPARCGCDPLRHQYRGPSAADGGRDRHPRARRARRPASPGTATRSRT